jgi:hypothetical protein
MSHSDTPYDPTVKQKAAAKLSRIPIKVDTQAPVLKKPDWIRVKAGSPNSRFYEIKGILRENKLVTVCSHLHDHGRQVHAPLPVLRRRPWPPRPAGCQRT